MNIIAASISIVISILAMGDMQSPSKNSSFRPIEQPWPVRAGVVFGGLMLVGTELWWFLGRKQQQQQAIQLNGVQEVLIKVDGGYRPDHISVVIGQPVRLSFDRQDSNSCLNELLIPDFGINTHLPIGKTTIVNFSPTKTGEYAFTCGMRMFRGTILVSEANPA